MRCLSSKTPLRATRGLMGQTTPYLHSSKITTTGGIFYIYRKLAFILRLQMQGGGGGGGGIEPISLMLFFARMKLLKRDSDQFYVNYACVEEYINSKDVVQK